MCCIRVDLREGLVLWAATQSLTTHGRSPLHSTISTAMRSSTGTLRGRTSWSTLKETPNSSTLDVPRAARHESYCTYTLSYCCVNNRGVPSEIRVVTMCVKQCHTGFWVHVTARNILLYWCIVESHRINPGSYKV